MVLVLHRKGPYLQNWRQIVMFDVDSYVTAKILAVVLDDVEDITKYIMPVSVCEWMNRQLIIILNNILKLVMQRSV